MSDRSVNLSDLASRAQSAPQKRQRSSCRNPECNNGMTPGLAGAGGGAKGQPIFGAGGVGVSRLMKWAWVPCLACNAPADAGKAGATYRDLGLNEQQIAQRAQMANVKAPYKPDERQTLSRANSRPAYQTPNGTDSRQLTELIEQNSKLNERLVGLLDAQVTMTDTLSRMSMQVASLLEDNAKLREQSIKPTGEPASVFTRRETLTLPGKKP